MQTSKHITFCMFDMKVQLCSLWSPKSLVVRAAASDSDESANKIAPLQLESPIGQFLSQILINHPHLVPAAVDQQLQQLQTDRDSESDPNKQNQDPSSSSTDLVLYRRIAEVKANERRKALEEILYALVVQKFMVANISLIPSITPNPTGRVDSWPNDDEKLKQLHSYEAYEMQHKQRGSINDSVTKIETLISDYNVTICNIHKQS
ncbi:UV-B-induced protein At3g17800, chloroplastic-like [Lotus japonicus]|uniref:UV-B-induced protein At3g17800, chloroplastic-like n=1 Tax=Lotus japonicus TaxID=34305 RepID=UPI00258A4528|nr:UV-B-induced protein At3g17800, chloroplastic-like [Lotus japonicus]